MPPFSLPVSHRDQKKTTVTGDNQLAQPPLAPSLTILESLPSPADQIELVDAVSVNESDSQDTRFLTGTNAKQASSSNQSSKPTIDN